MSIFETAAFWGVIKKVFEWLPNMLKKKVDVSLIMTDSVDVHELANEVIFNNKKGLTIDFFYLMNAFNGKHWSDEHRYKFRKIISGSHNFQVKNFDIRKWRKIPVDAEYLAILKNIKMYGYASLYPRHMPVHSNLRAKFVSWGLRYIRYYLIDPDVNGQMWYVMVGTHTGGEKDFNSPEHINAMTIAKAQLLTIIDKCKK